MDVATTCRALAAFAYGILPYAALYFACFPRGADGERSRTGNLVIGIVAGTCALCGLATAVSYFGFDLYMAAHPVLAAGALILSATRRRDAAFRSLFRFGKPDMAPLLLVGAAFIVRLIPVALGGETLGGGDARFHNILIRKILLERHLPTDWAPFAPIPVTYPPGIHVLSAFVAEIGHIPVHAAFNMTIVLAGTLTTGLIYAIARDLFHRESSGLAAGFSYAFLPFWGSLCYFQWGGSPNAAGMLFVCLLLYAIVRSARNDGFGKWRCILAGAAIAAVVSVVHHYTFLVAAILLGAGCVFAGGKLGFAAFAAGAIGLILSAPAILRYYPIPGSGFSQTAITVFREPLITVSHALSNLNPVFAGMCIVALIGARSLRWEPGQILVLAWFAGLCVAFVGLEYAYRAVVLISTRGRSCYTCLTPSRMATDMVYPMSIICGFVPMTRFWMSYRRALVPLLFLAALVSCASAWHLQAGIGVLPMERQAAEWIGANTPSDSMIIGSAPHLEYLSWRETSRPPLPASEMRNHPEILSKASRDLPEWIQWSIETGRPVYFVTGPGKEFSPPIWNVFSNSAVTIGMMRAAVESP